MYTGFNSWGLRPIASENNGQGVGFGEYYGVAIVPKAFCEGNKTLADLKGKSACMTGYRRSVGWNLPMGLMLSRGTIPASANTSQLADDAESVSNFFSKVCAVADGNGPQLNLDGTRQQSNRLCSACKVWEGLGDGIRLGGQVVLKRFCFLLVHAYGQHTPTYAPRATHSEHNQRSVQQN